MFGTGEKVAIRTKKAENSRHHGMINMDRCHSCWEANPFGS